MSRPWVFQLGGYEVHIQKNPKRMQMAMEYLCGSLARWPDLWLKGRRSAYNAIVRSSAGYCYEMLAGTDLGKYLNV